MRQNVCVIGAYLEINAFQGDALGKSLLIGGIPYTVVGVLAQNSDSLQEGGGDDAVYIPYQNAMQLSGTSYVSLYQITAASRDIVPSAQILLRDFLQDFYKDEDAWYNAYLVESMLDQVNMINAMMAVAMAVLVAIAAGGRHRNYEHHAGVRHRAHAGNRHPKIPGCQTEGHPPAVYHRSWHHFRHGRHSGDSLRLPDGHGYRLFTGRNAHLSNGCQWPDLQCYPHLRRHFCELWCERGDRRAVRLSPCQQGGKAKSH